MQQKIDELTHIIREYFPDSDLMITTGESSAYITLRTWQHYRSFWIIDAEDYTSYEICDVRLTFKSWDRFVGAVKDYMEFISLWRGDE